MREYRAEWPCLGLHQLGRSQWQWQLLLRLPDLVRALIGVYAKVAEMTTSPAKGKVVIETQWDSFFRRLIVSGLDLGILIIRPKRKGRIIRNEIIPRPGGFLFVYD